MTHKHYFAATKEFEILKELNGRKGFFIKVFFINDKVNGNSWQVTWEGIKRDIGDVVGVPIVLQEDLQHPNFSVQNFYAKGYIVDYILDDNKREASVIARILDSKTIKLIQEGKLKFVSPAVVARDNLSIKNIKGVDVLDRFIALHLAIVATPAYGFIDAKIHGTCQGMGDKCSNHLKTLAASLVADLDQCVENKIPIVKEENPDMPQDQVVAVSIEYCKDKSRKANSPGSDSQKVGPLTQTPLLKHKTAANLAFMKSQLNYAKTGSMEHNGKRGYWITAKQTKVFVANGQSVDEAMAEQCPCAVMLSTS